MFVLGMALVGFGPKFRVSPFLGSDWRVLFSAASPLFSLSLCGVWPNRSSWTSARGGVLPDYYFEVHGYVAG